MKTPPKLEYPFANSRVTRYVAAQIDALKEVKLQRDIAEEIGYTNPNMISMFKRGEARVPLDKIPSLAKALHVDPAHLFRLALEDYWPDRNTAITEIFKTIVSKNEADLLTEFRKLTGDKDPAFSAEMKKRLREAFKKRSTLG